MRYRSITFLTALLCLGGTASASILYTGSLSVGSGLVGTASWNDPATTLSYTVSYTSGAQPWTYSYTLWVPQKDISHFIIEASPSFTDANLANVTWSVVPNGSYEVGNNSVSPANTFMPADLWGIKFTPGSTLLATVTFASDRAPVWGDFYGRDGKTGGILNTAYNTGFTATDTDPTLTAIPLGNNPGGLLTNHILVPDTISGTDPGTDPDTAPEPATMALLAIGGLAMIGRRRVR